MTAVHLDPSEAWTFARLPGVLAARDIPPFVVVHVGAHHGEEVGIYRQCRFEQIILVEPDPRSLEVLRQRFEGAPDVLIVGAACAAETGTATLHFAERTVWSGLAPHPTADGVTVEVPTVALDDLYEHANVLVLDTQGSELELLKLADLEQLDLVIVETTRRRGDGAAYYDDAVRYMAQQGWQVVEEWVHDASGYTDTVFASCR